METNSVLEDGLRDNLLCYVMGAVDDWHKRGKVLKLTNYAIRGVTYDCDTAYLMLADDPYQGDGCYYYFPEIGAEGIDIEDLAMCDLLALTRDVVYSQRVYDNLC